MTKHDWKVGECGIFCGPYPHMAGLVNRKAKIVQTGVALQLLNVQFSDGKIYSVSPDDLIPTARPTPKDPFAPGEYVTCTKTGFHQVGDTVRVSAFGHEPGDWFYGMIGNYKSVGYDKSHFRPATPEEIAAYKAKYEADGEDRQPEPTPKTYTLTPYIKPETVTINGVEYIMTENV